MTISIQIYHSHERSEGMKMQNHLRKVEKVPEFGPVPFISSDETGFSVNGEAIRVLEQESRQAIFFCLNIFDFGKTILFLTRKGSWVEQTSYVNFDCLVLGQTISVVQFEIEVKNDGMKL